MSEASQIVPPVSDEDLKAATETPVVLDNEVINVTPVNLSSQASSPEELKPLSPKKDVDPFIAWARSQGMHVVGDNG